MKFLKFKLEIGFLAIVLLMCLSGCGSLAVDNMLTVAKQGMQQARENDAYLVKALEQRIQNEIKLVNAGFDQDVDMVSSGMLKDSQGQTIPLDSQWVKQARMGYFLLLKQKYRELSELEKINNTINSNLDSVEQLLNRASEINSLHRTGFQQTRLLMQQIVNKDQTLIKSDQMEKIND